MYIDVKSDNGELKNIISGNEAKAQTLKSFIPLEKLKPLSAKVKKEKVEKTRKGLKSKPAKYNGKAIDAGVSWRYGQISSVPLITNFLSITGKLLFD